MIKYQIVYWRDIPAQVKLRAGRQRLSRPLTDRFQVAIDDAAMRAGKQGEETYLEEWRAGSWLEADGEADAVADALVDELETGYTNQRLRTLVRNEGREQG